MEALSPCPTSGPRSVGTVTPTELDPTTPSTASTPNSLIKNLSTAPSIKVRGPSQGRVKISRGLGKGACWDFHDLSVVPSLGEAAHLGISQQLLAIEGRREGINGMSVKSSRANVERTWSKEELG